MATLKDQRQMIILVQVPARTSRIGDIIAIEAGMLKCPSCGNQQKLIALAKPCLIAGRVRGYRLSGINCRVCDTTTAIMLDRDGDDPG